MVDAAGDDPRSKADGVRSEHVIALLLLGLILAACGLGVLVVRADDRARADQREANCLQRIQTTATLALLAPASRVDADGRLSMMQTLGKRLDAC